MPVAHAAAVQRRTSPVELFWDLVFVFAVTHVSTLLARDLSWAGFGRAMLVLALVYCSGTISDLPTSPRGDEETDEPVEGGHVTRFAANITKNQNPRIPPTTKPNPARD